MRYTPLHINTEYSFQNSTIKIDELIELAITNKVEALTITDRNVMFGVSEFIYKVKKNNIKPIIGLDLDVEDFRLILLAKNYDGFQELNRLSSLKMKGKNILISDIIDTDLFVIDHPTHGHFKKYDKQLSFENYFIGTEKDGFANGVYLSEANYLKPNDIQTLKLLAEMNGREFKGEKLNPLNFNPIGNKTLIQQAIKIADECNLIFPNDMTILPKYVKGKGESSKLLRKVIQENAKAIISKAKDKDSYIERIRFEIKVIESLGFEDYFLIIWDLVKWAKNESISVGPGRGSAAGSLVSFVLGITEIDPIKYGLLFERFLNPERISMPDIDIDIQDNRRDEVIKYLFEKYGNSNVSLISTFSRLGAKSSLRDVARYMNIPVRDINTVAKLVPHDMSLKESYNSISKFRAVVDSSDEYTELFNLANSIEGLPRQHSTHAAGIVISDLPIETKAPTLDGPDGYNQIQFPMDYLEENKLLKIDLLGLRNLTIIKKIQSEIYENHNKTVNLLKLPLNDPQTLSLLSNGDTNGIFQFESFGMKRTLKDVGVDDFNDIVAILSLFRPGPLENIPLYSERKRKNKINYSVSKEYDEITKETYGIIIYQEQIMQIAQKISGMSFGQADILRRAIGKKKEKLIISLKNDFINGSVKKGYEKKESIRIYGLIEKFANYGFNKSHAVAYSLLAYRMAFLKARFKFEFYTAILESSIHSQTTVAKYVKEAKMKGITIIAPSINKSWNKVKNVDNEIILPLQLIKGLGDAAAKKIHTEKEKGEFKNFFSTVARLRFAGVGESTIQTLIDANAMSDFGNTQSLSDTLPSALRYAKMIIYTEDGEEKMDETIISKPRMIISEPNTSKEIFNEKKLFGFQLNSFVTSKFELKNKIVNIKENTKVIVLVERMRQTVTSSGITIMRINVSDSTGEIEITAFENVAKFIDRTKNGTIVEAVISAKELGTKTVYNLKEPWREVKNG